MSQFNSILSLFTCSSQQRVANYRVSKIQATNSNETTQDSDDNYDDNNINNNHVSGRPRKKQLYNSRYWVMASQISRFTRQQLETATEELCFLCCPCRDVISRTISESRLVESRQLEQWVSYEAVASWWEREHGGRGHCWDPSPGNDW
jgi:hypothetical protein